MLGEQRFCAYLHNYVLERITGRCPSLTILASLSSAISHTQVSRSLSFILWRFSSLPSLSALALFIMSMTKVHHVRRYVITLHPFRLEDRMVHSSGQASGLTKERLVSLTPIMVFVALMYIVQSCRYVRTT